jgi:hypothetical protein
MKRAIVQTITVVALLLLFSVTIQGLGSFA